MDVGAIVMQITSLGIERDGFRNGWLAINAGMADEVTGDSWAGIYVAQAPEPSIGALMLLAFGALGVTFRRRPNNNWRSQHLNVQVRPVDSNLSNLGETYESSKN
jgi:hypothetical protein